MEFQATRYDIEFDDENDANNTTMVEVDITVI